jgi:hypothetical protein
MSKGKLLTGILLGCLAAGVTALFWDDIRKWLNTTVLDWVEKSFGYQARKKVHKVIVRIDKVGTIARRQAQVFIGKILNREEVYVDQISVCELDAKTRRKLNQGTLIQEFKF